MHFTICPDFATLSHSGHEPVPTDPPGERTRPLP